MAMKSFNDQGYMDDKDMSPSKGFMGNKKPKEQGNEPIHTVAHFVKLLRKQRKEMNDANS